MTETLQLSLFDDIFDPPSIEDQIIEKALLRGSGFSGGKERIKQFALSNPPIGELANKLRIEYGIGGWGKPTRVDGELHAAYYDGKGMTLCWMHGGKEFETKVTWPQVSKVLKSMVERRVFV